MSILKKLQHYRFTDKTINNMIQALKNPNKTPNGIKTEAEYQKWKDKWEGFITKDDKLIYEPLDLEVVRAKDRQRVLREMYDSPLSAGKGILNFYWLVCSKYLGILRKHTTAFLKQQSDYQMTRPTKRVFEKKMIVKKPFSIFACDLIDLNPYFRIAGNKGYRYIFTCVDLFSKYVWLVGLKSKTAKDTAMALKKIFKEAGEKCSVIVSDLGKEFEGKRKGDTFDENEESKEEETFAKFLEANGVKKLNTRSYSPQPNVEAKNREVRKVMRVLFLRTKSLVWYPYLKDIQDALNTQTDVKLMRTPEFIMKEYKAEKHHFIEGLAEKELNRIKKLNENFTKSLFKKGDFVRIKLSAIQSGIRKKIKMGNKKLVVVPFSPDIYRIEAVRKVTQDKLGIPTYTIVDKDGNRVMNEKTGNVKRFKQSDLLLIPNDANKDMTTEELEKLKDQVDKLNRLHSSSEIFVEGDLEEEPIVEPVKPVREKKPKALAKYELWTELFRGKEFTDTDKYLDELSKEPNPFYNTRWVIQNVDFNKHGRKGEKFIVNVFKKNTPDVTETYTLWSILDEAQNNKEVWWKDEMDAIKKTCMK